MNSGAHLGPCPIVDAHVHFWDPRQTPRDVSPLVRVLGFSPALVDWVAARVFPGDAREFFADPRYITRSYLPGDLADEAGDLPVCGVVHVEAGWKGRGALAAADETRWLEGLGAVQGCSIEGIVGHADLSDAAHLDALLAAHGEASAKVRGVRDMLAWHPSPGVLNSTPEPCKANAAQWRHGFEKLSRYGLMFEATCYDHQLDELCALAAAYPDQPIVLCHAGTPVAIGGPFGGCGQTAAERQRTLHNWQEQMLRIAEQDNVMVKVSGLAMPVCGFGFERWQAPPTVQQLDETIGPLAAFVIDTFGARRCMLASNFPIEKVAVEYRTLWRFFLELARRYGDAGAAALLGGNARRVYGLHREQGAE